MFRVFRRNRQHDFRFARRPADERLDDERLRLALAREEHPS